MIQTARLRMIPFSPEHLLALIERDERFEERFGLRIADELPAFFASDEVSPTWLEALRTASSADLWVHGLAVIDCQSASIIGSVGFKGPPDQTQSVEIAYGIVPSFQGRGYATEAAGAAATFALESGQVRRVVAHTRPTNNASARVLIKCGFEHTGDVVDPEDGLVWRWERGSKSSV
jgi:ribosomal-protein-alanine N-acetyltransferase